MAKTTKNKRKATQPSLSAASMGKALVLLATSCAALTTGRHAPPTARGFDLKHARSDSTALHYRELDEYHQMTVGESRPGSMIDIRVATPTTPPTPLQRDGKTSSQPDEQIVMDEYLEYVERRYSRMHRRPPSTRSVQFVFPAKMTLFYHPRTPSAVDNEALRALGLTGLVSERLRQRLNAPREFRNEHESAVNFFHHFVQEKPAADIEASTGGRLSPHVSLSFVAQFGLLARSLSRFLGAYAASVRLMSNFALRAVPAILERGGVRHSIKMMSVASVAVLLMFRPLFRGFIKQA